MHLCPGVKLVFLACLVLIKNLLWHNGMYIILLYRQTHTHFEHVQEVITDRQKKYVGNGGKLTIMFA